MTPTIPDYDPPRAATRCHRLLSRNGVPPMTFSESRIMSLASGTLPHCRCSVRCRGASRHFSEKTRIHRTEGPREARPPVSACTPQPVHHRRSSRCPRFPPTNLHAASHPRAPLTAAQSHRARLRDTRIPPGVVGSSECPRTEHQGLHTPMRISWLSLPCPRNIGHGRNHIPRL